MTFNGPPRRCIRLAVDHLNKNSQLDERASRIYLDNAATSWPKPQSVLDAVADYYLNHGSAAGRGVAADAVQVDRAIQLVRAKLSALIGAEDSNHLAFAFNGTDALNMAIRGVLRQGDHVITSVLEHNSVLRPLHYLKQLGMIDLTIVDIAPTGIVDVEQLEDSIVNNTKLICISHVSNVLGTVQPVKEIGSIEKPDQCLFLIDGAQSTGHLPVDVNAFGCDFFASSGHKGLLGPLGTGFLYSSDRAIEQLEPYRLGGTGTSSEKTEQPNEMPFRLESGNLNVGGILGMGAGIEFIETKSVASVQSHLNDLIRQFLDFASDQTGIKVFALDQQNLGAGVVSFQIDSMSPSEVATVLDSQFGIQVRSGLHCSPLVHKTIGSDKLEGTVRISVGPSNTAEDIDSLIDAMAQLMSA